MIMMSVKVQNIANIRRKAMLVAPAGTVSLPSGTQKMQLHMHILTYTHMHILHFFLEQTWATRWGSSIRGFPAFVIPIHVPHALPNHAVLKEG